MATQICASCGTLPGRAFARDVHAAVYLADRVAPLLQMFAQVFQCVAVLGEDEQLAPAVVQFLKLGLRQTLLEARLACYQSALSRTARAAR